MTPSAAWWRAALPAALLVLVPPASAQNGLTAAQAIRIQVEALRTSGELVGGGAEVAAAEVLADLYEQRAFAPAWPTAERADAVLEALEASREDGLDPLDYHLPLLQALRADLRDEGGAKATPMGRARYDVLLTDAVARLVYHLEFGKVDPVALDPNWNLDRTIDALDPPAILARIAAADSVAAEIRSHRPGHPFYGRGLAALAAHEAMQRAGGWERVAPGPALQRGDAGARVGALRRRLAATGDLAPALAAEEQGFDGALERALAAFQARHYLDADGVAGETTIAALNVPVEARVDQLRVNLERARWVLRDLPDEFVLVDIAGFELTLVRGGKEVWHTRVQVGRPYRKTPVFRDEIRYLDFNPTWTIPPGILRRDTLPAVQRDPSYLAERNIRVIDADGAELDPHAVDWTRYTGRTLPYRLVQDPGPNNALGRVKFMFPNPHLVFLHDTPSRSLFERSNRAFSSGCIRVERPFELAELLLDDEARWNAEAIRRIVAARKTRTVFLPKRVAVILLYWTVELPADGSVRFKRDLYQRDAAVLAGLAAEFGFREAHRP